MTAWGNRARPAATTLDKTEVAVRRAAAAEDFPAIRSGLEHLGRAAGQLEATPIPQCIDPGGHYLKWLDGFKAAGDNARVQSGLSGLQLAEEPLPKAKRQRQYLNTELKAAGYTTM